MEFKIRLRNYRNLFLGLQLLLIWLIHVYQIIQESLVKNTETSYAFEISGQWLKIWYEFAFDQTINDSKGIKPFARPACFIYRHVNCANIKLYVCSKIISNRAVCEKMHLEM